MQMLIVSGYPIAAMPLGIIDYHGRPFGMVATARAHEDMTLVKVMHLWRKTFGERKVPDLDDVVKSTS
jgi:amidase